MTQYPSFPSELGDMLEATVTIAKAGNSASKERHYMSFNKTTLAMWGWEEVLKDISEEVRKLMAPVKRPNAWGIAYLDVKHTNGDSRWSYRNNSDMWSRESVPKAGLFMRKMITLHNPHHGFSKEIWAVKKPDGFFITPTQAKQVRLWLCPGRGCDVCDELGLPKGQRRSIRIERKEKK